MLEAATTFHMESLCRSALSLPAMSVSAAPVMTRGRTLVAIPGGKHGLPTGREAEPVSSFLPEVSSHLSLATPAHANPENSPRRVFLEIFLIFGICGLMAVAMSLWIPAFP